MRYVVALALFLIPLIVLQNPGRAEPSGAFRISGEITISENMEEAVHLNISLDSVVINGTFLNASDIRETYENGGEEWMSAEKNLSQYAVGKLEQLLRTMNSRTNGSPSVSISGLDSEGSIYLEVSGTGYFNISDHEDGFPSLLLDSGAIFNIPVKSFENLSVLVSVPDGFLINGARAYEWNGETCVFAIKKGEKAQENIADVFVDIYRMDTSGMEQNIYVNLSIDSEIYRLPIPEKLKEKIPGEVEISWASMALFNYSLNHSFISYSDFERYAEQMISELEDRIVREFPGVKYISTDMLTGNTRLKLHMNAKIEAPVDSLSQSSFLRWYASQKIAVKMAGIEGFTCNYTVVVPEGMKILGVSSSPRIPVFYTPVNGRSAFRTTISRDGEYSVSVNIGILVDIDPLIPLLTLSVLAFIFWIIVRKYVPERRKRHG